MNIFKPRFYLIILKMLWPVEKVDEHKMNVSFYVSIFFIRSTFSTVNI
jgi:hypothetical protein